MTNIEYDKIIKLISYLGFIENGGVYKYLKDNENMILYHNNNFKSFNSVRIYSEIFFPEIDGYVVVGGFTYDKLLRVLNIRSVLKAKIVTYFRKEKIIKILSDEE